MPRTDDPGAGDERVDLSEFLALHQHRHGKKACKIGFVLTQLDEPAKLQLTAALAQDMITATAISMWCEQRHFEVSLNNVVVHRARKCSCYVAA